MWIKYNRAYKIRDDRNSNYYLSAPYSEEVNERVKQDIRFCADKEIVYMKKEIFNGNYSTNYITSN